MPSPNRSNKKVPISGFRRYAAVATSLNLAALDTCSIPKTQKKQAPMTGACP
jgi:hypothetical protein